MTGAMRRSLRVHEPHSMLRILRTDETLGHDSSGDNKAILNDTFVAPAASNAFFCIATVQFYQRS